MHELLSQILPEEKRLRVCFRCSALRRALEEHLRESTLTNVGKLLKNANGTGLSTEVKHLIRLQRSNKLAELPRDAFLFLHDLLGVPLPEIEFLRTPGSRKQTTLPARVDETTAYIVGAHLADGYLSADKHVRISEGRKQPLAHLQTCFEEVFGASGYVYYEQASNTFTLTLKNRIIGSYFYDILDIPSGKKASTARVPRRILESKRSVRLSCFRGIMTFDGSVKTSGHMTLCIKSKELADFVEKHLTEIGCRCRRSTHNKNGAHMVTTATCRPENQALLDVFQEKTAKHRRLQVHLGLEKPSLEELEQLFPTNHNSKTSLREVFDVIKQNGPCAIDRMHEHIREAGKTTLYKYLHLLVSCNLVKKRSVKKTRDSGGYRVMEYSIC